MLTEITKPLPALRQQLKYMPSALTFEMAAPIIMIKVVQVLVFEYTGNPIELNEVVETRYVGNCPS